MKRSTTVLAVLRAAEILGAIGALSGVAMAIIGWLASRGGLQPGLAIERVLVIPGVIVATVAAVLWVSAYSTRRLISRVADR